MNEPAKMTKYLAAAVVILAIYFAPALISSFQRLAILLPFVAAASRPQPPAPATSAVPKPLPANNQKIEPAISPDRISGTWRGGSLVANRGRCEINLEITPDAVTPARYSGALVTHCMPVVLPFWGKTGQQAMNNGANALTPANAILSGTFNDNSLVFNVDKSIAGTCPITAATVTPFGTRQLAIQWKDGCGDGDMILVR